MKKLFLFGVLFLTLILVASAVSAAAPEKAAVAVEEKAVLTETIAKDNSIETWWGICHATAIVAEKSAMEGKNKLNGSDVYGRKMPVNKVAGAPGADGEENCILVLSNRARDEKKGLNAVNVKKA